ncbi:MAG: hypothetical protein ABI687_04475 [Flavitalea sp.]
MNTRHLGLGLLTLASFFALVIACKKTSDNGDVKLAASTMTYKINGNENKLTTCIAIEQTEGGFHHLGISALTISDADKALAITMASSAEIKAGFTFNQSSISDNAQGFISYLEASKGYVTVTTEEKTTSIVEVHITEKTATYVKGTFTGKLYDQDTDSDTPAYTIAEGQFNASIQQQ